MERIEYQNPTEPGTYQSDTVWIANWITKKAPDAIARVQGDPDHRSLRGTVAFYRLPKRGVLVTADITGLPEPDSLCANTVHGFHIHEGGSCSGNSSDPFADTGSHYNPYGCEHPEHAGDMPPLFSNNGSAWLAFLTNRVSIEEIIGRTVVIHEKADDFHTQPAGDSGMKIGCGVIRWNRME